MVYGLNPQHGRSWTTALHVLHGKLFSGWTFRCLPAVTDDLQLTASFTPSPGAEDLETRRQLDTFADVPTETDVETHATGWQFGTLVRNSVLGGRALNRFVAQTFTADEEDCRHLFSQGQKTG